MEKEWKPIRVPKDIFKEIERVQESLQKHSIGTVHTYQAIHIAISTSSLLSEVKR